MENWRKEGDSKENEEGRRDEKKGIIKGGRKEDR